MLMYECNGYKPAHWDWFFSEVKGDGDSIRDDQADKFAAIIALTKKPIVRLDFKWAPNRRLLGAIPE
jgi:hypothetical protein